MGHRGSGSTRYSGELVARAVGNKCSRRVWKPVLANTLQYSRKGRTPFLTQKSGRPQPAGLYRIGLDQSDPTRIDTRLFFACGSSGPVRVEHEVHTAVWLVGTLAAPSVQGHRLPLPQVLWPYESFFQSFVAVDQKASLASLSL